MGKLLNLGMVGFGLHSIGLLAEIDNHPLLKGQTKLVAGFDPDPKAIEMLKKIEGFKMAETFEDLLDTKELDAIIISSPPQYHAEQAVTALESDLHVFSEIPMAIRKDDINKIIDAEDTSGNVYQLGENYCFFPEVIYAAHLVSTGKIGEPVYAESEYLHDVTYRWRDRGFGDVDTPRVDSWYQLFDPMMYAHSIGPAQVALGGLKNPMPFIEVTSFANDIGGYQGDPICKPAKAFQVALFRTETNAIAKCANAYVFAREPSRISIQVVGRTGTYECYQIGKPGRLFITDGHKINKIQHRKGSTRRIDQESLTSVVPQVEGLYYGANARILEDWLQAIKQGRDALIHARVAANFCLSGIQASQSAHDGGKPKEIKKFTN
ncbi:MAG TPA: Gfo/Idh/MocA family oxidoreductase [Candidatus Nanopelagicaceae bacterium]|nr:Gfo/Idh/MocA family oxidoreductase [Candidatus Nanopelagicaceae bacterium]